MYVGGGGRKGGRTFLGPVAAVYSVVASRSRGQEVLLNAGLTGLEDKLRCHSLSDERQREVNFVVDPLHGGQNHLPQAVLDSPHHSQR